MRIINVLPEDLDSRFYLTWCFNNGYAAGRYETLKLYISFLASKGVR